MKRRAGRDEEVVSIVVLAVILFGIVIGSAVYTQAQLDAAAELAMVADVQQPQTADGVAEARLSVAGSYEVQAATQQTAPETRMAVR